MISKEMGNGQILISEALWNGDSYSGKIRSGRQKIGPLFLITGHLQLD